MLIGCLLAAANCGHRDALARLVSKQAGVRMMRSNSGTDEGRDNLHDPTIRDRNLDRGDTALAEKKPKAPADHRSTGRKD
jgi:hypothetical protein